MTAIRGDQGHDADDTAFYDVEEHRAATVTKREPDWSPRNDDTSDGSDELRPELDVKAALETMRRSTQQLDVILEELCAYEDCEKREECVSEANTSLLDKNTKNLTPDAYFAAVEAAFDTAGTHRTLRVSSEAVFGGVPPESSGFEADPRLADVMFLFPASHRVENNTEDGKEMVNYQHLSTSKELYWHLTHSLMEVDHLLPEKTADTLVSAVTATFLRSMSPSGTLKAVEMLFPPDQVSAQYSVGWYEGNRVCQVHTRETQHQRQWGIELVLESSSIIRGKAFDSGTNQDGPATTLPSRISASSRVSVFLTKKCYAQRGSDLDTSVITRTSLSLILQKATDDTISNQMEEEPTSKSQNEWSEAPLPEFLQLWVSGKHEKWPATSPKPPPFPVTKSFDEHAVPRVFEPYKIDSPFPRNRITQLACGRFHTLLLNDVGMVFSCGHAMDGALGHGEPRRARELYMAAPKLIDYFFEECVPIRAIACGGDDTIGLHSAAVSQDGNVYAWGVGLALGLGSIKSKDKPERLSIETKEKDEHFVAIACGNAFCTAITAGGDAYSWGKWGDGRLGLGKIPVLSQNTRARDRRPQLQRFQLYPRRITTAPEVRWTKISCGEAHCIGISQDGKLFTWGRGRQGQLGHGVTLDALLPTQVEIQGITWRDAAAGADYTVAVDTQGRVWSWGGSGGAVLGQNAMYPSSETIQALLHRDHQLLRNRATEKSTLPRFSWLRPRLLPALTSPEPAITTVSAGSLHVAALSERGDLYLWGRPASGLAPIPTLAATLSHGNMSTAMIERVFCGGDQIFALTSCGFLSRTMQKMYNEFQSTEVKPLTADLLLIVDGRGMWAHKFILARRSPVFCEQILMEERTELDGDEPNVTELVLSQLRLDVARLLLEFIYTDNLTSALDPLSYLCRDLLRAAEQYELESLAVICRERLQHAAYDGSSGVAELFPPAVPSALRQDLAFTGGEHTPWSDLTILAENRPIAVHRCMLMARSEYFRALFAFQRQQQTSNSSKRVITVEESYRSMLRVLQFIYNDELTSVRPTKRPDDDDDEAMYQVDRTEELLEDLMAADKYGLARMKHLCEHHIVVTPDNCVDVLVVADFVHAPYLKEVAMSFIQAHLPELTVATSNTVLARLTREHSHLLEQLYERIQRQHQQQQMLRDWQRHVETLVRAQQDEQDRQWQETSANTKFPWVALILAFVFATLYLNVMNHREFDYPVVPAINVVVIAALCGATLLGKL